MTLQPDRKLHTERVWPVLVVLVWVSTIGFLYPVPVDADGLILWCLGAGVIAAGLIAALFLVCGHARFSIFVVCITTSMLYVLWRVATDYAVYSETVRAITLGKLFALYSEYFRVSSSATLATLYFDFVAPAIFILFLAWLVRVQLRAAT